MCVYVYMCIKYHLNVSYTLRICVVLVQYISSVYKQFTEIDLHGILERKVI